MAWQPDYLTVDAAARYLRIDDDADNDELADAIAAASRGIDDHCNRQFGKVAAATTFYYKARQDYDTREWRVDIDDLHSSANLVVVVNGTTISSAGYELRPSNAVAKGKPYTLLAFTGGAEALPSGKEGEVAITSPNWGWPAVPTAVRMACKIQLSRVNWRRGAPAGIAGSPDSGSEIRLLAKLDPDAINALRGFRRSRRPR